MTKFTFRKKVYLQKTRKSWLQNPLLKDWVIINEDDHFNIRCKYCNQDVQSKLSVLKSHASCKKHRTNSFPFKGLQKKIKLNENISLLKMARSSEARLALYIACHSSINPVHHLINCVKENHKNEAMSEELTLGRTKCTAILKNVWAPYFKSKLKLDLANSIYSLIIDEATDITNVKFLGIVIKYYSVERRNIITQFLAMMECYDSTADGIVNVIKKVLNEFELSIENLCGLGTDNAQVMVGVHNSVHKKLQNLKSKKYLTLVPCSCHSLQLAVTHAVSKSFPPNLEYICNETYSWFSKSAKRQYLYKNIYKAINNEKEPLKIPRICTTRWMSIETNLKRICEQWQELKTHFGLAKVSEKCYACHILYDLYEDETLFLLAIFLKNILKETQTTNKALQSKTNDPLKILDDIYFLVNVIASKIYIKEKLMEIILGDRESLYKEFLLPNPYFGYEFETLLKSKIEEKKISSKEEKKIRKICLKFLKLLVSELKSRLPKNIIILKKISEFSIDNALKVIKNPISEILSEYNLNSTEIENIQNQWNNIAQQYWDTKMNITEFWIQVHNFRNSINENPFKDLSNFVISLLVLPFSNAEVERLFSLMTLIKNKQRSKMSNNLLCSLIRIREGVKLDNVCCCNIKISDDVVNKIGLSEKYQNELYEEDKDNINEFLDCLNTFDYSL